MHGAFEPEVAMSFVLQTLTSLESALAWASQTLSGVCATVLAALGTLVKAIAAPSAHLFSLCGSIISLALGAFALWLLAHAVWAAATSVRIHFKEDPAYTSVMLALFVYVGSGLVTMLSTAL